MLSIPEILKQKNARVLVVGGSGRLGQLLRKAWPQDEAPMPIWQARKPSAFAGTGPDLVFDPLAEPDAFQRAAQAADAVLMLSGIVSGLSDDWGLNTRLAQAALAAGMGRPVLLASSAAVYGARALCREGDPLAPVAPYGASKAAMEAACANRGLILRIGNVAGADALLGQGGDARHLDICADGLAPRRSYIGPVALAQAIARLVRLAVAGADLPQVLNVALPGVVGMDALLNASGITWLPRAAPQGVIPVVELDVTRALRLGLVPEAPATAQAILADLARARS